MSVKTKDFGSKLRDLLESKDMSQKELAKRIFVTESNVSMYLSGKRLPRWETIKQISNIFNVTTDYLLGMEPSIELNNVMEVPIENIKIPILGEVRAGMPTLISEENTIGYEYVSNEMLKYGELFALIIKGDSMQPRLEEGDVAIIQRTSDVESGSICVALVNGDEATVKKLVKSNLGITLVPFNSNYEPIIYSNDDIINKPVIILGKVIEVRRKF